MSNDRRTGTKNETKTNAEQAKADQVWDNIDTYLNNDSKVAKYLIGVRGYGSGVNFSLLNHNILPDDQQAVDYALKKCKLQLNMNTGVLVPVKSRSSMGLITSSSASSSNTVGLSRAEKRLAERDAKKNKKKTDGA